MLPERVRPANDNDMLEPDTPRVAGADVQRDETANDNVLFAVLGDPPRLRLFVEMAVVGF